MCESLVHAKWGWSDQQALKPMGEAPMGSRKKRGRQRERTRRA